MKGYTPVAEYFIALSNETGNLISNLKLQKLVYYAQAWHLANFGVEIFKEDFQAWVHGPVIPSLYSEYKFFGWKPIIREDLNSNVFLKIKNEFSENTLSLLELVVDEYFGLPAFELERLTHNEDPWISCRKGFAMDQPSEVIIGKDVIKSYYSKFLDEGNKENF
jgi:uncharacterized phage-associated protein